VDGIDNPNPEDFETIQKDPNLKLYIRPPLNIAYLGLNNNHPPLDNEKVRQAIAMAIDRARLVKNFYPAGSMVAEQFVPPALKPGYTEGLKWYDYNPQEAKRLLAEAGYPNGFDITLSYRDVVRGYLPRPGQVAQDIQAQLAEVGIRVKIKVMESGASWTRCLPAASRCISWAGWRITPMRPTSTTTTSRTRRTSSSASSSPIWWKRSARGPGWLTRRRARSTTIR
jgi:ABC-type transport system substrate-binding protein